MQIKFKKTFVDIMSFVPVIFMEFTNPEEIQWQ